MCRGSEFKAAVTTKVSYKQVINKSCVRQAGQATTNDQATGQTTTRQVTTNQADRQATTNDQATAKDVVR